MHNQVSQLGQMDFIKFQMHGNHLKLEIAIYWFIECSLLKIEKEVTTYFMKDSRTEDANSVATRPTGSAQNMTRSTAELPANLKMVW